MDIDRIPHHIISSIGFSVYGLSELQKISVLEVTNPITFDTLGHANKGGLHDPLMGPADFEEVCESCGFTNISCPGHLGYIKFPLPVFNPVFFRTLYSILKGSCFKCHRLLAPPWIVQMTLAQLEMLDLGFTGPVYELEEIASEAINLATEDSGKPGKHFKNPSVVSAVVKEKLDKKLKEIKNSLESEGNKEDASVRVKNVVECRQRMIKNFIRDYMVKASPKCPHCGTPRTAVSALQNARFIFGKHRGVKRKIETSLKSKIQKVRPEDTFDELVAEEEEEQDFNRNAMGFDGPKEQTYFSPQEAQKHLHILWDNEGALLSRLFGILSTSSSSEVNKECPIDIFLMDALAVPPTKFRPIAFMKGRKYENPQTTSLCKVLKASIALREVILHMKSSSSLPEKSDNPELEQRRVLIEKLIGQTLAQKLHTAWNDLQVSVNSVVDSDLDKMNNDKTPGVKQIIEKKEGLFRKHMMGKRVNYACRSVISPDPYIMVDEIGVPTIFATKLTYPQPVTPWNVRQLRQAVLNGPDKHPGAVLVENEDGSIVKLNAKDHVKRQAVAKQLLTPPLSMGKRNMKGKPKIVHRHLQSGDVLLLNRQPTLHKPSIMAHKARVLHGEKTLRMHYANCKCYNADFDGDEMNAHFPQSELGRAEAYNLASVNNNYLVPKDGTPLSGLIQDHMVSGVLLTIRGRFFNRQDYQNLVYGALTFVNRPFKLLPPAIWKPEQLWSGKQIVSTLILNIIPEGRSPPSLQGKAKIGDKNWKATKGHHWTYGGTPLAEDDMSESQVIIRHGELLCGVLDKAHYGPTPFGLVHCFYEFYGGQVSSVLLTSLARLFTHFLQSHIGFTLGIQDILVTEKANRKRCRIMRKGRRVGDESAAEALGVADPNDYEELRNKLEDAHRALEDRPLKQMDMAMKSRTDHTNNSINKVCIPVGLLKKFPENNLQLMVNSGAKGATVNCMQISCLLGQIELEGRRVPLMMSGKTLPSFLAYDTSPRAGGFIDGRFLTGIRPQEFFFHCMAGREGLVDTAVKTSRSGYLQRCLIKHLEGLIVNYDLTVRDSDGSVIQFKYGEDGLDILKSQMLKSSLFPLMVNNYQAVVDQKHLDQLKSATESTEVEDHNKMLRRWRRQSSENFKQTRRVSPFMHFANDHVEVLQKFYQEEKKWQDCKNELHQMWFNLNEEEKNGYEEQCVHHPDPLISLVQSDVCFGAVSEKLEKMLQDYIDKNPEKLLRPKRKSRGGDNATQGSLPVKKFKDMLYYRAMKAICEPGEAVGLLAAQSVGEPSTQMTLNTFHFAGRGEMNVTLGIPRMREILMTGSANLATPCMDLPLRPNCPDLEKRAEALKTILTSVTMAQVLELVTILERTVIDGSQRHRKTVMRLQFLPRRLYKDKYATNPSKILHFTETSFFKRLISVIKMKMLLLSDTRRATSHSTRSNFVTRQGDDVDDAAGNQFKEIADDGGASSDEGEGDGDTTDTRSRQRHDQDREYEEKEEEDVEATKLGQEDEDLDDDDDIVAVDNEQEDDNFMEIACGISPQEKLKVMKEQRLQEAQKRKNFVLHSNPMICSYEFDVRKELWCELGLQLSLESGKLDLCSLVKEEAQKAIIHQTPGIKRAFLVKDPGSENMECDKMIKTDGVNFLELLKYDDVIDMNRISSNDIHAVAQTYGIEAANKTVVKEVSNVFAAYGIEVDPRHLMLIADYMTFDGTFRGCNRMGMEINASPLQQMTFETTMHFLRTATLSAYEDNLKSPSSCLVVGHVVKGGTGCHELLQPLVKLI